MYYFSIRLLLLSLLLLNYFLWYAIHVKLADILLLNACGSRIRSCVCWAFFFMLISLLIYMFSAPGWGWGFVSLSWFCGHFPITLQITHMEMIKGIQGHGYHDELVVPIIENTAHEGELRESLTEAVCWCTCLSVLIKFLNFRLRFATVNLWIWLYIISHILDFFVYFYSLFLFQLPNYS